MDVDRNSIERRDFPVTRRGYDPAEVDAHLAGIADAVEDLKGASAAGGAGRRVQSIIEAAERSAAEIVAGAREEAELGRSGVKAQAEESLRRAGEAESLLEQAGGELERLRASLAELRSTLAAPPQEAAEAAEEPDAEEEEGEAATAHAELPEADEPVEETQVSPAEAAYDAAPPARQKAPAASGGGGHEGARLIALNMALNGTPREETARYLDENFALDDPDALLDEVYSG